MVRGRSKKIENETLNWASLPIRRTGEFSGLLFMNVEDRWLAIADFIVERSFDYLQVASFACTLSSVYMDLFRLGGRMLKFHHQNDRLGSNL